ncbi:MAG: polysaccharide deacetylase family protein [Candidatus Jordarchaeaceae archaeon]
MERVESNRRRETLLLFTCDFEYSPEARSRKLKRDDRLNRGYKLLVDILNKHEIKSTFFVEGKLCIDHPEFIEDLYKDGHEIGSHGFDHICFTNLWPTFGSFGITSLHKRKVDIEKSKQSIYSIIKKKPVVFRAPYLAIDESSLKILENEGFLLDSSLYNPAFGKLSYPYHPSKNDLVLEGEMKILEVPVTVSLTPYRKFIYWRYPSIFEVEEKDIPKAVYLIKSYYHRFGYPFALFVTLIHPYELCSSTMLSKVLTFLKTMNSIGATSLTATRLIEKFKTVSF